MKNTENLIKQSYEGDCGVASIAMYAGSSYRRAETLAARRAGKELPVNGMSNDQMAVILKAMGFQPVQIYTLITNVPAILSVPSLGTKKRFHYIYWDGTEIYDPSNYETYETEDFMKHGLPLADAIVDKKDLENVLNELPSHYVNEFDWEYLSRAY